MSALLEQLGSELGGSALTRHDPIDLDGVAIAATLSPGDGESLSRAVTAISRAGLAAVPRGGGRHLALGNPPERADLFLSTTALSEIQAFEPAEGVCRAEAGTRLAQLREVVLAEGWELPLDGDDSATLGGALAAGSVGPRSHGFGPARDAVLGLDVVLGSGERTRCGGRVMKNVTGYDMAKLYTGSLGSLGVIESAWLRLRPRPETTRVIERRFDSLEAGCDQALLAARRPTVRACALLSGSRLVVEMAGDAAGVAADAAAIGGEPRDVRALEELSALQWGGAKGELRFRIAALPSELRAVLTPLLREDLRVLAYPGLGLVYVCGTEANAEPLLAAVHAAASAASGPLRCEAAPVKWKRRGDVFGASADELRLYAALKQLFDPQAALSPGRLFGTA